MPTVEFFIDGVKTQKTITDNFNNLSVNAVIAFFKALSLTNNPTDVTTATAMADLDISPYRHHNNIAPPDLFRVKMGGKKTKISAQLISELSSYYGFLFSTNKEGRLFADPVFFSNFLKKITIKHFLKRNRVFYGPEDALTNITWDEFITADCFLNNYIQSKDKSALDSFIGCLYRTPMTGRLKFDSTLCDTYRCAASELKEWHKLYIFFFFTGCKKFLRHKFKKVFGNQTGHGLIQKEERIEDNYHRLTAMLGGGNPAQAKQIYDQPLYLVLYNLEATMTQDDATV